MNDAVLDTSTEPSTGRPRILIADDEADLRMILEMKLARSEMDVTVAENGNEARELAHRLLPDLAVFDVMMPGISGLDLVRELRAEGNPLPIVLLSARATDAEVEAGYDAGCTRYVTKPFSPTDLVEVIEGLLNGS